MHDLAAAVAHDLDADIVAQHRLAGGDVAESYRFDLAGGRRVFAKTHVDPPPDFFTTALIVHAIKFGGTYASATDRALDDVLR